MLSNIQVAGRINHFISDWKRIPCYTCMFDIISGMQTKLDNIPPKQHKVPLLLSIYWQKSKIMDKEIF